ncbi:ATP-binding protein [Aridibaculum aurantiacum]|uniref:ATP-binding protein n=1 Tax=Aridibaculum aurantiacum TaxID=2810307 RepID=UPI001A965E9D|nr:ATP-binding protein [Aridibaculum aurantiacum]
MRFLNKLIFINSATIAYAEVMVNGNVHLIGTQGVGKSTLLRAILFFYNADTLKLGISKEKKSFAEYYFPYSNSFLIYEVMRENGPYCIIAFKSQGKVCFRFMDGGYDKKYFLTQDGQAYQKWEDNRKVLDENGIFSTRKIDRYEEYRDILYGNTETGKKEFTKYALLQSKQYQNIPRTIQNVFLNSKLEAEFIKQTIIMSLNEEDISIDLQNYNHHLKNFEEQLADIYQYKQPAVQKLAENVVKYHLAIRHLEKDKNTLSMQLTWAIANVQKLIPKLQEKKERAHSDKEAIQQKIENAETRYRNKAEKIKGEISVLESDLKKAKEKSEHYTKLKIDELLERVGKKKEHETIQKSLSKELELLTAKFGEVSQKYDALLASLDNDVRTFVQTKENEILRAKAKTMEDEKAARKAMQGLIEDIRQSNQQAVQQANEAVNQQQQHLQNERVKREAIRHQRFFEAELVEATQQLSDLKLAIQQAEQLTAHNKSRLETLQKQWELDEATTKQNNIRLSEKLQEQVERMQQELTAIDAKLANSEGALYGWLNKNKQGWENTIGKVVDEDILFNNDLQPQLNGEAHSLYGIQLDLADVKVQVKTLAEYEKDKQRLQEKLQQTQHQLDALTTQQADQVEKLRKKYQPQIRECKEAITEQQYRLEQDTQQLQYAQLNKKDLELKAAEEKKQALADIDSLTAAAHEALLQAQQQLEEVKEEVHKQVKAKERELDRKISALEKEEKELFVSIGEAVNSYKQQFSVQKKELLERRQQELEGKGGDTKRINEVEKQLQVIKHELDYIEKNRDVVAEYKKDKRELIDKIDDLKSRKALLEQQYETEEQKHKTNKAQLQADIAATDVLIHDLALQVQQAEEDSKAFTNFSVTDAYNSIDAAYKEEKESFRTDKRCKSLIDEINRCYYNSIKRLDELRDTANKFLGYFSMNNIFNFKTGLSYQEEYLQFADQLNDFINNSKIEEFEKRVNERFATIIHSVGKETGTLMSKGGEIQKVINEVNRDFDNKNFVGAIQKIELRLDESANKVVQLLLQIKKYNDEHAYDIGGLNLFSSVDQDSKNKKAVDLLKQLGKAVGEYKKDYIALSDTFELKFRIEENQNDTGWVEKLSNVGSEGTDVLVKAMINIMLLNVFKEGASKRFKDFRLHCMMDEIGKLHPNNVKGILQFANDRNINLINGSPTETNALDYKHIYKLEKDGKRNTRIKRIITNYAMA